MKLAAHSSAVEVLLDSGAAVELCERDARPSYITDGAALKE